MLGEENIRRYTGLVGPGFLRHYTFTGGRRRGFQLKLMVCLV